MTALIHRLRGFMWTLQVRRIMRKARKAPGHAHRLWLHRRTIL
ncbi:hypothetical protein [Brucella intermedia]|nr:hypothetical protein [Brucella intermedia]WGG58246.1 hypothetical protein QA414_07700 [Brucella intermedia]